MHFQCPEQYRVQRPGYESGNHQHGAFLVPYTPETGQYFEVFATAKQGWEHVTATIAIDGKKFLPSWPDMCFIKSLFWTDDCTVIQFHPEAKSYIHRTPNTLHLWRRTDQEYQLPPKEMV